MPSADWYFKDAVKARNDLVRKQQREIRKRYNEWAKEAREEAKILSRTPGMHDEAKKATELYYQLKEASKRITSEINKEITRNVKDMGEVTVRTNKRWLKSIGLEDSKMNKYFSRSKDVAIRSILTGNLYENKQPLSKRVWQISEQNNKDIYAIVSKGIATNSSIEDIAKQLEKYLVPTKNLGWKSATFKNQSGREVNVIIHNSQVDWRAQRLARTMVQHAYEQTLVALTKDNPFVLGYIWHADGGHPCEVCEERDGRFFTADNLPLDHPNGMCDFEVFVDEEKAMNNLDLFYESPIYYPDIKRYGE